MELKTTESPSKRVYLLGYVGVFSKGCIELDETAIHNSTKTLDEGIFFCEHFLLPRGFKMSCSHTMVRKNLNLMSVSVGTIASVYLKNVEKFPFGGLKGYEDF